MNPGEFHELFRSFRDGSVAAYEGEFPFERKFFRIDDPKPVRQQFVRNGDYREDRQAVAVHDEFFNSFCTTDLGYDIQVIQPDIVSFQRFFDNRQSSGTVFSENQR